MSSLLEDVRTALANSLRSRLTGINVYAYPGGGTSPPRISIFPSSSADYVDYWMSMGPTGLAGVHYELWVEAVGTDDVSPQMFLDAYLSVGTGNTNSVVDAIRADHTLDGLVDDVMPTSCRVGQLGADGPIGAVITVDVYLRKQGAVT